MAESPPTPLIKGRAREDFHRSRVAGGPRGIRLIKPGDILYAERSSRRERKTSHLF